MKVSGSTSVRIAAPVERCREALLDFASYTDWFPGVAEAQVVKASDGSSAGRLLFSAGVAGLPDVSCVLRYEVRDQRQLRPVMDGGDLSVEGPGWRLEPVADGETQATYDVTVEMRVPGGFLAERALRGPARRWLIDEPPERLRRFVEEG